MSSHASVRTSGDSLVTHGAKRGDRCLNCRPRCQFERLTSDSTTTTLNLECDWSDQSAPCKPTRTHLSHGVLDCRGVWADLAKPLCPYDTYLQQRYEIARQTRHDSRSQYHACQNKHLFSTLLNCRARPPMRHRSSNYRATVIPIH